MLTSIPFGITTWLVGCVTFLLAWAMIRRPKGLPPGPFMSVPILGYLPFISGTILDTFAGLRRKYGDVFHLYLGNQLVIVISGYDIIKETLVQNADVFSHRPQFLGFEDAGLSKGLITSSGAVWREHRKFALEALREFGFGRNILQDKIQEEIAYFLKALEDKKGKAFDIKNLIHTAISNVTCNVVLGKRFTYDDPQFHKHLHILDAMLSRGPAGLVQYDFLKYLPGDVTGHKAGKQRTNTIREEMIEVAIQEHLKHFQPDCINDFIDAYIKEMKDKEREGVETSVTADHLWRVILDLFIAGTETTGTALRWALVFLLHHPHIQDRLQQEVQDKVGFGRLPSLEDRPELPFLNAFIMELLRVANIAPLAVPHAASVDFPLRGYRIPKDAMIFVNLETVLKDPEFWDEPDVFNPDRFLQDGKLVKPEQFIPFGIGRRVCLGESLAKMELFLFLASLLQRFRFEPAEKQPLPALRGVVGSTHSPKPFPVKATLRI